MALIALSCLGACHKREYASRSTVAVPRAARIAPGSAAGKLGTDGGSANSVPDPDIQERLKVSISDSKNYLVDGSGKPFLVRGDSAWSMVAALTRAETIRLLDSRKALGFNAILTSLIEPAFSGHTPKWRNADGELPFANPDDWSVLNDRYFAHVDWVLEQAAQRGILLLLAPAYLGYECGAEGWCPHMKANGLARLTAYGQYVGTRYKSHPNIIWVEGGDHTPRTTGSPSELDLVNAVANGIRQAEQGAHLHVAHWAQGVSGGEGPTVSWLDVDTTYAYTAPQLYTKTISDRARNAQKRPFILIEGLYENEHSSTNLHLRAQMYQPVLSGSTGFVFGNFPIWALWSPGDAAWQFNDGQYPGGWQDALDGNGTRLASVAFDFFSGLAWQTLVPDVDHRVLTAGYGSGKVFALCAADAGGALAVTYMTGKLSVTFDMSRFAAPVTARWFDPALGTYLGAAPGAIENRGSKTFTPPGANGDDSADWLLILSR